MYLNYISFNNRFVAAEEHRFENLDTEINVLSKEFRVTFNSSVDSETVKRILK